MVDLVKIRKKKAEGKGQKAEGETKSPEVPQLPEAQTPAAPPSHESHPSYESYSSHGTNRTNGTDRTNGTEGSAPTTSKLEKFKQEAGKRRDTGTTAAAEESAAAHLELLTFIIAGEHYAVDIERIVEIVTPRAHTRIPNADSSVVGIISLRGTIVTLVDVRRKLRHPASGDATVDTRVVVIDFRHEIVGFVVDRVLRVVKIAAADIEPHPVVHAAELDDSIRGVFRTGGALTILLDLDKLLDHRALAAQTA